MSQYSVFTHLLVAVTFACSSSWAQLPSNFQGLVGGPNEFFAGKYEGKPLIRVNLIGGVKSPGVYHIPIQTNLVQLLAFAGGVSENAVTEEIAVRSMQAGKSQTSTYDLDAVLKGNGAFPVLQENDIVHIKSRTDTLQRTSIVLGVVGTVLGIVLTTLVLSDRSKGK